MFLRALLSAVLAVSLAAAAQAASVSSIEGQGSVSRGGGYQPLQVGAQLEPGNRVLASQGSSVTISFSPTCAITVRAGESYRIPAEPHCEAAAFNGQEGLSQGQLLGIGLVGAGAAIGIGAIIANASGDNDGAPVGKKSSNGNNDNGAQCDSDWDNDACPVSY